ncbi:hypothetical protein [Mycetocola zhadangensis]|uniref:Flagellar protein FlgN n=1 Tax=Mycetocola zhadangensis TaxID=1164595 RepID=A0A3L7J1K2_9MICO|nr:hypothetical protein [Mycetocola zhadangensis]RLQ84324.1 hypothetical protein D9V28_08970 [Mycetocola zhadangensis]GGE94033.1 hypothetical protein GCM10011313_16290 [Mycetocola zhadangensis]
MDSEIEILDQAARLRALDVLSEQRRHILALAASIEPMKQHTMNSAAELSWRSFSRAEFERRVEELGDRLVAVTVHLDDALDQCARAKAAVLAGFPNDDVARSVADAYQGYPASTRQGAPSIPTFARTR